MIDLFTMVVLSDKSSLIFFLRIVVDNYKMDRPTRSYGIATYGQLVHFGYVTKIEIYNNPSGYKYEYQPTLKGLWAYFLNMKGVTQTL
jgi:hypothetical protein